ncbi:Maltose permease MAL61 [Candida viswanathii]|uniref:Maltose permease MAL61 n=1 Tax=Candida viswanathii TaxID=5486 RepID=A0A367YH71_9ASCO|nr:Maltose permease MAL61 [Candida viswanathii]
MSKNDLTTDIAKLSTNTSIDTTDIKVSAAHAEGSNDISVNDYISKFLDMSNEARDEDQRDKNMTLSDSLKMFPKACFWSVVSSAAIIVEGYDTNLLASFYADESFAKKFGKYYQYQVPAKDQIGALVGVYIGGVLPDKIGYKRTIVPALFLTIGLIFIPFFAPNVDVLTVSFVLLGINWGSYQAMCVAYAMDISPTPLRVYLTTFVNCCWVIGQLISFGWAFPLPIIIATALAPELPWFLARTGQFEKDKRSLTRLLSDNKDMPSKDIIAQSMLVTIQMTVKEEEALSNSASILECFRDTNWRRTRIASCVWLIQNITGSSLMGYSTYFCRNASVDVSMSFIFSIIQYCLVIAGTIGSWFLSQILGRFEIYFYGLISIVVLLTLTGGLGCSDSKSLSMGVGSMPSAQLRSKTVMIARNVFNIAGIVVAIITPYMWNPTEWNWKAEAAFLWAELVPLAATWVYFELPETKGRTFAELDKLFAERVPARKFKTTVPTTFDAGHMMETLGDEGVKSAAQNVEAVENQCSDEKA